MTKVEVSYTCWRCKAEYKTPEELEAHMKKSNQCKVISLRQ